MKIFKYIYTLILIISGQLSFCQIQLERQVIGSAGGYHVGSSMSLTYTIGETTTKTLFSVNKILTQGFQQPNTTGDSLISYEVINETCRGAENGTLYIDSIRGCKGPYTLIIRSRIDTSLFYNPNNLSAGSYLVKVIGITGCFLTRIIDIGLDSDEDCKLKFYSGLTPNGDGNNDIWHIDNIEQFPENEIKIFNRWGDLVWSITSYDNIKNAFIGQNNNGADLPDGTYFYVANVSGKIYKNWIEITR